MHKNGYENNMKTFKEYVNNLPFGMDDFGDSLHQRAYAGKSGNNNLISESSLHRLLNSYKNDTFAVMSAYRAFLDDEVTKTPKSEKIQKNRDLRAAFNEKKMGVYQLVGHWKECTIKNIPYEECPENKKIDVIERSYFIPNTKYSGINDKEFYDLIISLGNKFKQDTVVVGLKDDLVKEKGIYLIDPKTENVYEHWTHMTLDKIGRGYSEYFLGHNRSKSFMFEGIEIPNSNSGKVAMNSLGILY